MKKMKIFMERQELLSKFNILKILGSTCLVFFLVAYATKENVGTIYEMTKSCIFSMVMAAVWVGICATISIWSSEEHHIMPLIKMNILPVGSYIWGNILIQTMISIVQALIGTVIFAYFFEYDASGIVLPHTNAEIMLTLFLIIYASSALGMFVGLLISNIKSAMSVLPLLLIAQFLFSKGIFELEEQIEKVSDFIIARYGMASLGSILDINQYPIAIKVKYPIVEQTANELFKYSSGYILENWMGLAVLTIIPLIAAYLVLTYRKGKKT